MKRLILVLILFPLFLFAEGGVDLDLIPGNEAINVTGGRAYLLIKLTGGESAGRERAPLNIGLVIDRSGSMAGSKIRYVKKAAADMIKLLDSEMDKVSLVIYDDKIDVLYPAQSVDKNRLISLIDEIYDRGSTALHEGMMEGIKQTLKYRNPKNISRVLLLSDGLANVGQTDPEIIQMDARKAFEKGVSITTLGVGSDYNENLMVGIARASHGNYYFIESPTQIEEIFSREFSSLLSVVAKDIKIRLIPLSRSRINGAVGYTLNGNVINAYDIYAGKESYFLIELNIPRGALKSRINALKVELSYFDVLKKQTVVKSKNLELIYLSGEDELLKNKEVYKYYIDLRLAENLESVTKYLDKGKNKKALELANKQLKDLRDAQRILRSPKIDKDIQNLEKQIQNIKSLGQQHYQHSQKGRLLKKAIQQQSFEKQSK